MVADAELDLPVLRHLQNAPGIAVEVPAGNDDVGIDSGAQHSTSALRSDLRLDVFGLEVTRLGIPLPECKRVAPLSTA
jgi:hypothetical protein